MTEFSQAHAEHSADLNEVSRRLAQLNQYGPIKVTTRVQGISGARYFDQYDGGLPVAWLGADMLETNTDSDGSVVVHIYPAGSDEPLVLAPDDIESVGVDHPHGESMPLHGTTMLGLVLEERHGITTARWGSTALEFGVNDTIETSNHPECPGIYVIRTYTTEAGEEGEAVSLEDAQNADKQPRTFFVTETGPDSFIVTSNMGCDREGPAVIAVRRPRHPGNEPLKQIEMVDVPAQTSDQDLLELHVARYREGSQNYLGYPRQRLEPFDGDSVFLYIVSD